MHCVRITSPPARARTPARLTGLFALAVAIALGAAAAALLAPSRAHAVGTAIIAIDVDPATPGIQSTVSIPQATDPIAIDIVVRDGDHVGAFEFMLSFDAIALQFIDWQPGPFLGSTGRMVACQQLVTENTLRIGCTTSGPAPPEGASGDGVLGTLRFHPRFPGGTCFPMLLVETASVNGDPLLTTGQGGCIVIVPPTPTPSPTPTSTPVPSATPTPPSPTRTPRPTDTPETPAATPTTAAAVPSATPPPGATATPGSSATRPPPPPPAATATPGVCARPPAYWLGHADIWPVDSLKLGGRSYNRDQLRWLLALASQQDASLILAQQLTAAGLNIAAGARIPADHVEFGDRLLAAYASANLPHGVASDTYQGQGMVWAAAPLAQDNAECPESTPVNDVLGGRPRTPSGLPGTGGFGPFVRPSFAWVITVLSLIIGVLLFTLMRRTLSDESHDRD